MTTETLWRHKKHGTVHKVITDHAGLQCSCYPAFEEALQEEAWTVYRNVHTMAVYVRPTEEFLDGRFEPFTDGVSEEPTK